MSWQDPEESQEGWAYWTSASAIVLALVLYESLPLLFGQHARFFLFAICTLGSAVVFAQYVGAPHRLVGFISGAVAGICGVTFFLRFGASFHAAVPWLVPLSWPGWVFLIGCAPGFALLALLQSVLRARTGA